MNNIKPEITYEDFSKLDIRVGEVKEVHEIEGADKLYKLIVNIGEQDIQILSGIKEFFKKEDLIGEKIIVLVNLAPRKMRGEISNGMLLAVDSESGVNLLTTKNPAMPGDLIK